MKSRAARPNKPIESNFSDGVGPQPSAITPSQLGSVLRHIARALGRLAARDVTTLDGNATEKEKAGNRSPRRDNGDIR